MGETASRSRSMLSNPRMSFRVASGNDVHSSPSETVVSAVIRGGCPRRLPSLRIACPQLSGPLDQPEQPLPADNRRAHIRLCNDPCTVTNRLRASGSLLKRAMANFAAADLDGLVRIVKRKLKKIQYRPHLIDGCLAATGLAIEPW